MRNTYRLRHRKGDVRIFIHELQNFGKRTRGVDKTWARAHGLHYGLPCGLPYFDDFIISQ